jgi:hypothetical protein
VASEVFEFEIRESTFGSGKVFSQIWYDQSEDLLHPDAGLGLVVFEPVR